MKYIRIFCGFLIALLIGCTTNLDVTPQTKLTTETTFVNNSGFLAYSWQFYDVFTGYGRDILDIDLNSDMLANANANGQSAWAFQLVTIPSSDTYYNQAYTNLRGIHIMLQNIPTSKLNDTDKKHWQGVGSLFRAINYMNLLNRYGAVPLILKSVSDTDTGILFGAKSTRDSVATQILQDLTFAEANIKTAGDGPNSANVHVARAILSRFGLREGTWRKYHGLPDAEKYLTASAQASEKLMSSFPTLQANYDLDFNSASLANAPGIILYKQYESNQIVHYLSSRARQSAGRWDLTKKAADSYLMSDGKTTKKSPLFEGEKSPYTEFRKRDKRLYYTVPPPYKVNVSGTNWTPTANAADAEYFPLMNTISGDNNKSLPTNNWGGIPVRFEPHFADDAQGQPFSVTYTGYRFYKFANKLVTGVQNQDINDAPVLRMGEVLVNFAEAKYELGQINQDIINKTVNALRARGGVAALDISNIPDDPDRDATVPALLWEIRRERAVELMGEGFRFDDLRRWKKLDYITVRKLGRWIKKGVDVSANAPIPLLNGGTEGYVAYEPIPPTPIPDYYYLYPLPSDQIALNPKITQNPGWVK